MLGDFNGERLKRLGYARQPHTEVRRGIRSDLKSVCGLGTRQPLAASTIIRDAGKSSPALGDNRYSHYRLFSTVITSGLCVTPCPSSTRRRSRLVRGPRECRRPICDPGPLAVFWSAAGSRSSGFVRRYLCLAPRSLCLPLSCSQAP